MFNPAIKSLGWRTILGLPSFEINRRVLLWFRKAAALFPNLTVAENLMVAARPGGASFDDVYCAIPKLRTLQKSRLKSLRGERQMVAIARSLCDSEPRHLAGRAI